MPKIPISRTQVIASPIEKVFEVLRDIHSCPDWSPWLIADPDFKLDVQNDYYSWEGAISGSGRMDLVRDEANESITYDLSFVKPWKSQARIHISLAVKGDATEVTWTLEHSLSFFLFWKKKSIQAYLEVDYDRGFLMLKNLIETGSVPSHLEFLGREPSPSFVGVGIKRSGSMNGFEQDIETSYKEVRDYYPEGKVFSVYYTWDLVRKEVAYFIGVRLDKTPGVIPDGMELINVPGMEVYALRHRGPYSHLSNGWSAGRMHGRAKIFRQSKRFPPFEIYEDENWEEPVVKICLPMK
ncbi:MAG: GyrI-like domain-containing protein [Akkermansiaceae bacterium]